MDGWDWKNAKELLAVCKAVQMKGAAWAKVLGQWVQHKKDSGPGSMCQGHVHQSKRMAKALNSNSKHRKGFCLFVYLLVTRIKLMTLCLPDRCLCC